MGLRIYSLTCSVLRVNFVSFSRYVPFPHSWNNSISFRPFRFILAMENNQAPGYISEKIANAFMSGGGFLCSYFLQDPAEN